MKLFFTIPAAILIAGSSHAAFFTNSLSADSFVRATAPTLNYGGAGSLSVAGSNAVNNLGVTNGAFDTFMRFNTAALAANFDSRFGAGNWVISGVKLRVTEMGLPPNNLFNHGTGAFEIRWIANDIWIEGTGTPMTPTTTGINYNSEPALLNDATDVSVGIFTNSGVDGVISFPLALPTAFTSDIHAGGEVGLYLTAVDPGIGFTFNSRTFMTNSARPFLEISAIPRPGITGITLAAANIFFTGTNGAAGETYHVMASTDLALPLTQWMPVSTNVLDADGNFTLLVTNPAGFAGQQFFILGTQ